MLYMTPYRFQTMAASPSVDSFSSMADEFFRRCFGTQAPSCGLRVDVEEKENAYQLRADLPGVRKEDIGVEVQDGLLTISANVRQEEEHKNGQYLCRERYQGSLSRSFRLEDICEDEITAQYQEGVLTLMLPKRSRPAEGTRKIEIQ